VLTGVEKFLNETDLDTCLGEYSLQYLRIQKNKTKQNKTKTNSVALVRSEVYRLSDRRLSAKLVTTDELLGRNSSGSALETREYGRGDPLR
jgi:hypothetical protein